MSCCFEESRSPEHPGTGQPREAVAAMRGLFVLLFVGWAERSEAQRARAITLGFSRTASGVSPIYPAGFAQ